MTTTATRSRYRLALSPMARGLRVAVLVGVALAFLAMFGATDLDASWQIVSVIGFVLSLVGLRILVGPVVVVRSEGIRIQRNWPIRRDIPWYRIHEVEVVPIAWVLRLELNNGEEVELPAVENLDELFEQVEELRRRLDEHQ